MAQPQLNFAFDVVNQTIVAWNGSSLRLDFGQTTYQARVRLIQPTLNSIPGLTQYEPFDDTGYDGIRMGIWSDSTGTLEDSGEFVLALTPHPSFTKNTDDPDDPYWEGAFNCYTAQVAEFLGSAKTKAAFFAVNLVAGSTLSRVYDHTAGRENCVLNSATDDGSGVLPLDMTQEVPTITLPCHIKDPATGELYALTRTSAGVLTFVWINP